MAVAEKKCGHLPCVCPVPPDKEFCSESCEDTGAEEVEIACECGHEPCTE